MGSLEGYAFDARLSGLLNSTALARRIELLRFDMNTPFGQYRPSQMCP
jgi:hypothetical protein